jgi:dienelactone hydrolase
MRLIFLPALLIPLIVITGCKTSSDDNLQDDLSQTQGASDFDPANSIFPFPNNLFFNGTLDGTLNIPVADANDLANPQVALNGLDGFSTVAPFSTGFSGALDPTSVNGSSVRVFEVALAAPGGPAASVTSELLFGADFIATVSSADSTGKTLAIVPLRTLTPKTSYYVVITNKLRSAGGGSFGASGPYALTKGAAPLVDGGGISQVATLSDAQAAALEPLRQLTNGSETTITTASITPALTQPEIILSWSFTTQSITEVLTQVRTDIRAGAAPASALVDSTTDSPLGGADIFVGTVDVPYYLTASTGVNDPTALGSFWQGAGGSNVSQFNPSPVATSTQSIPLIVSIPKPGGAGPYPTVIYQHGITTNRTTMLAIADSMAQAGFAVVAIDMPMHGLTGNETNGTENFKSPAERTFDLDLLAQDPVTGATTASGPDGTTDSSGSHYINLANLLNSRDNVRQSVSDLFALTHALSAMSAGADTFDTNNVYFLGHSLGGLVGLTFLAIEPPTSVKDAVVAMTGGGIAKLLDGSANFGPVIAGGLAANGVIKGTPEYESFLGAAQTAIDSGDPINHAAAAATGRGILFFEVVGGAGIPSDLTIPNRVPDGNDISNTIPGPLSGSDPLAGADADIANPGLGLTQFSTSTTGTDLKALVRFTSGDHGSILSPAADAAVTLEMQTEAASFLASDGNALTIGNTSVIAAP